VALAAAPLTKGKVMPTFHDMELSAAQLNDLECYYKDPAHRASAALRMKSRVYINTYLIRDQEPSKSFSRYSCCSEGTDFYTRVDGGDIFPEDIEALNNDWKGQENKVKLLDSKTLERRWLCDSSG
jgi:hypothetical protein